MPTARDRPPEEAAEDTSFARGLRLLLTVADRGEVRADELGALLDMPLSTVYRYLRTLAGFGFVDRHGSGYRLGPRLVISSGAIITSEVVIRAADPVLRMLAEETGETAVISRRIGLSAVCLHQVESTQPLRVSLEPGSPMPLERGALGQVLLAYAPPEIIDEALSASPPVTTGAGSDEGGDGPDLRRALTEVVAAGLARSEGGDAPGAVAIAVPILREDGIVAAIGVLGPVSRCGLAWRTRVARLLPEAARSIVAAL